MVNNFQRPGSISNADVGRDFEASAQEWFLSNGFPLQKDYGVEIGLNDKKERRFDLGSSKPPVLVECKSHKWTAGRNVPSAKLSVWNESMYYFFLAPRGFRKILFVLRDYSMSRRESLAEYYGRTHRHLIPDDVEIMEFDPSNLEATVIHEACGNVEG